MTNKMIDLLTAFFALSIIISPCRVKAHGRLIDPPSRSSMWRYGFSTTPNYNDHIQTCGGFARQHTKNGGKCGACGDPWDGPKPNEAGGRYAQGIIVRKYPQNSEITIKVELTANHKGHFEFRLCPNNDPKKVVSEDCLDQYQLVQANGDGQKFYPLEGTGVFESRYLLPKDLICSQCVLQWRYIAAHTWGGPCPDGSREGLGCGPQQEFRACADIAIYDDEVGARQDHEPAPVPTSAGIAQSWTLDLLDSDAEANYSTIDNKNDKTVETELEDKITSVQISSLITTPPNNISEPIVWSSITALVALTFAALGLSSLLGWFYRKEIRRCICCGSQGNNVGQPPDPPNLTKMHQKARHYPSNELGERRQITPDLISGPIHVTINGLPFAEETF